MTRGGRRAASEARTLYLREKSRHMMAARRAISLADLHERDGGVCQLCGERCAPWDATRDHVTPWTRGGPDTRENLQLAHEWCNQAKGNELDGEAEAEAALAAMDALNQVLEWARARVVRSVDTQRQR